MAEQASLRVTMTDTALAYARRLLAHVQRSAAGAMLSSDVIVAGERIRLHLASSELANALLRSFSFTEPARDVAPVQLEVTIGDDRSLATPAPLPPEFRAGGERLHYRDETVELHWAPENPLSLLNVADGQAVWWLDSASALAPHDRAAPLRTVLTWWARNRGLQLVHAGAVGSPRYGGVLLVGPGSSGKSTTAVSCVGSVLGYIADDYCVLDTTSDPATVHSLYSTAKLTAESLRMLDWPAAKVDPVTEKATVSVPARQHSAIVHAAPVRAVVAPRVTGAQPPRVSRISAASCLRRFAPSSVLQIPGNDASTLRSLAALVRTTPCYELELGPDIHAVPALLEAVSREGSE